MILSMCYRSNSDSEDDMEPDTVDQEYPSLDSVPSDNSLPGPTTFSPRNSEPPSLTESMQLMDEILSDKTMDRIERIDKLEAILSAATLLPSDPVCFKKFGPKIIFFPIKIAFKRKIIENMYLLSGDYNTSNIRHTIELKQFVRQLPIHKKRVETVSIPKQHSIAACSIYNHKFLCHSLRFICNKNQDQIQMNNQRNINHNVSNNNMTSTPIRGKIANVCISIGQ